MRIAITRIAYRRWERCEIGNWLMACAVQSLTSPEFAGVKLTAGAVDYSPVEAARNIAVRRAKDNGADILVMVDDDMDPHRGFLATALREIKANPQAVVGSPARGARPECHVNVSEIYDSGLPERVSNQDASRRTGVQKVHCIGGGLIAIGMQALELIQPPYFMTEYADDERTIATTTEDMYFTRKLSEAGGTVLCAWQCWSGHAKQEVIREPQ